MEAFTGEERAIFAERKRFLGLNANVRFHRRCLYPNRAP
jgi:hypothetical protein